MGIIVKAFSGLVALIALLVGLLVATSNNQSVDVDLVLVNFSSSLGVVITGAFCGGGLIGLSLVMFGAMSGRLKLALKDRELQVARKELDSLRALEVKRPLG